MLRSVAQAVLICRDHLYSEYSVYTVHTVHSVYSYTVIHRQLQGSQYSLAAWRG